MKKSLLAILSIGFSAMAFGQTTTCAELFISEYVEGSGNNKAAEIFNPTASPVNLSNYRIVRYSNGSVTGSDSLTLSGTLAAGDVWVVSNGQTTTAPNSPACDPALQALADQLGGAYPDPLYWNGNDAFALVKISPYMRVDIFGKIGEDPGSSWTDVFPYTSAQGSWITLNHTLQRKATVLTGVTTNPSAFNVTLEWDSLPQNTWTGLGQHACNCLTGVNNISKNTLKMSIFPNPSNGVVFVNASEVMTNVTVSNVLGQSVYSVNMDVADQHKQKQLDLGTLPAGMYIVDVKFASGQHLVNKINIK